MKRRMWRWGRKLGREELEEKKVLEGMSRRKIISEGERGGNKGEEM
jgi:hypothetical protein